MLDAEALSANAYGAAGDGLSDDAPPLQAALEDAAGRRLIVPPGVYRLGRTLHAPSGTRLHAQPGARFVLADGAGRSTHDYLLTNRDHAVGNTDIEVSGGDWSGNAPNNRRDGPILLPHGYSGVLMHFFNVRGLRIHDLTLRDAESYFFRMSRIRDFEIVGIRFESAWPRDNNDGIHLGGECEDGLIRHLRGTGAHVPNDDMVALNADDALDRVECQGLLCGPIRRVHIEDIQAEHCHSFVRLLSVRSPIEDVHVRGLRGGCSISVLNMDACRGCRIKLFDPAAGGASGGVGVVRRVTVEDVEVAKAAPGGGPLFRLEERADNLAIRNFRRRTLPGVRDAEPTLQIHHVADHRFQIAGLTRKQAQDTCKFSRCHLHSEEALSSSRGHFLTGELLEGGRFLLPRGGFKDFIMRQDHNALAKGTHAHDNAARTDSGSIAAPD